WLSPRSARLQAVRRAAPLVIALVVLALGAQAAYAKLVFVELAGRTFTPGELIESRLEGCSARACFMAVGGKAAALIPAGVRFNRRVEAPSTPVGHLTRTGRLRFVMPELRTGRYQVIVRFFVEAHNGCRWAYASNPFRVVGDGD